jgi:hypothetical protein
MYYSTNVILHMYFTSHRQYCEAVLFMLMVMYPSDDGLRAETCQG